MPLRIVTATPGSTSASGRPARCRIQGRAEAFRSAIRPLCGCRITCPTTPSSPASRSGLKWRRRIVRPGSSTTVTWVSRQAGARVGRRSRDGHTWPWARTGRRTVRRAGGAAPDQVRQPGHRRAPFAFGDPPVNRVAQASGECRREQGAHVRGQCRPDDDGVVLRRWHRPVGGSFGSKMKQRLLASSVRSDAGVRSASAFSRAPSSG